jgi:RNA recognition motif-containing protein
MENLDARKVSISNLGWDVDPKEIRALVEEIGKVDSLDLKADPLGKKMHMGFGTITFESDIIAQKAANELNGKLLSGRPMLVKCLVPPKDDGKSNRGDAKIHALPASVQGTIDSMTPAELWAVLSEIKTLTEASYEQARALLLQYPNLTHSLLVIEERLGMLQTTPPKLQTLLQEYLTTNANVSNTLSSMSGVSSSTSTPSASQVALPAAPASEQVDPEQVALLRAIIAMSDAEVAALPADQLVSVQQVRLAVKLPISSINAMPPEQRDEMLQLRQQLVGVLGTL